MYLSSTSFDVVLQCLKKGDETMYKRIKDLREDADKSQKEVADALGMWLNTYRNYENGKRVPPFDFMVDLAKYYNVSLDYFAELIDIPKKLD